MPTLRGRIVDATSGAVLEAKVRIVECDGRVISPDGAVLKVGPGPESFYCPGQFQVSLKGGPCQIVVERGTEYKPLRWAKDLSWKGDVDVELRLERWIDLPEAGWYPGNTHIHYDQNEKQPYERLKLEPHVNDFSVTVVSILRRWDLKYASNRFPIGLFTDYSTAHHVLDIGEENRHNFWDGGFGYGHIMLFRITEQVDPVSRGMLVDDFNPDYPPLCFACDDAKRQGGVVLWCHNGLGMEAPVAAVLGKLDGMNLFDPYWMDPEYDLWYQMLNCGFFLPASTGSDWFVCSSNRVYAQTGTEFTYDRWINGLKRGETFITNGPALLMTVNGMGPGALFPCPVGTKAELHAVWKSHHPINLIEVIENGAVIAKRELPEGSVEGELRETVTVNTDGWLALRCIGHARDSFEHHVWAHTSPVYTQTGTPPPQRKASAQFFVDSINRSLEWVNTKGRFLNRQQRNTVANLFREGQRAYEELAR